MRKGAPGDLPPRIQERARSQRTRIAPRMSARSDGNGHAIAPLPLKPADAQWTDAQWRGIVTTGHSLLVSAAAGSGKTAVLAERCAYLVCDAPQPCNVDELLVVTFTEAAAATMKSRIIEALKQRASQQPSERLTRQLALAEHAHVSTLHSFCHRLLRQHFHLAGLDPSFRVLDADEAHLLRRELAREQFRDCYELDHDGSFQRLIDAYGDGDDERVLRQVLHTHELLTSVVDPREWMARSRQRIAEAAEGPLEDSQLGSELITIVREGLDSLRRRCDEAIAQVRQLGFAKYEHYLIEISRTLGYWAESLTTGGLDALHEVVNDVDWKQMKLPTEKGDEADRDLAKAAIESVRGEMKEGPWRDILRFTSSQWQEGLRAVLPHAHTLLRLVDQFGSRYENAKSAARAYDFADLERFALRVLWDQESDSLLSPSAASRAYHRRFAHVLVDEYQDINEVQDAILRLVSRECVADERDATTNLFCVGDVKQSIYRFRLADPARFLARQHDLRRGRAPGEVIDLQHNFRSRAPLLDAINCVFRRLMTAEAAEIEYDQTHELRAGAQFPDAGDARCFRGAPIELHLLPQEVGGHSDDHSAEPVEDLERSEREAILVAQRIRQIVGLDGAEPMCVIRNRRPERATFSDIVILLRSMKHKSDQFADVLRQFEIPVYTDSGTGYFQSVEVQDVLSLLTLLDNQRQDIPLAAVLRGPIANLAEPETCLARIRVAYPAGDDGLPFHEAVFRYAKELDDELAAKLRDFFNHLRRWRQAAHRRPLAEVLWQIYQETGYLAFVAGLRNGEQRVANLMHLHERAGQFGSFQRQGLSRFMRFLRDLEEESDLGLPAVASEAQDVVRIMSVHRSKGLEFPIVVLPDLGKKINLSDCHGHILADRLSGLGMSVVDEHKQCRYPSLALTVVRERLRRQTLAEELRVLYVAMTRAKEHLILVGTCEPKSVEKWQAQWRGRREPLPADAIRGARTMLDWLGPVAAGCSIEPFEVFQTTFHSSEEVAGWQLPGLARIELAPEQQSMARLEPLAEEPPVSEAAARAIARVSFEYPLKSYSDVAAAQAVTALKDGAKDRVANTSITEKATVLSVSKPASGSLALPKFLAEDAPPAATDRGTATHLVLQHLNFVGLCDRANIEAQVQSMVSRHMLTPAQAQMVDIDTICWLLESSTGQLLREHASRLRRELSVYFPADAPSSDSKSSNDPMDRVMVRGRLDVLIPLPDGAIILDYKTDNIRAQDVPDRGELYRPQLDAYREAIERILSVKVTKVCLAFLGPRVIWEG